MMYEQEYEFQSEYKEESHKKRRIVLVLLLVLLLVLGGFFIGRLLLRPTTAGSRIIPVFSNEIQEEQELLTDRIEKSRITVSLIPSPYWDEETQELGINFVVSPDNNGFSERFVIQQDGRTVYESACVMPGYALSSVKVPDLNAGAATATVFAVDNNGFDYGNPVSVELMIQTKES